MTDDLTVLYGHDPKEGIVAAAPIEQTWEESWEDPPRVRLWVRDPVTGALSEEEAPLYPFLHLERPSLMGALSRTRYRLKKLDGTGHHRYLAVFRSWSAFWDGWREAKETTGTPKGKKPPGVYAIFDPVQQYLTQTGRTMFKGMDWEGVSRLAFDIEAFSLTGFPNAENPDNPCYAVTIKDNRGFERVLYVREADIHPEGLSHKFERFHTEEGLLRRLTEVVRERDPDVLCNHNVNAFDIPYLAARYRLFGLEMRWGRRGEGPEVYDGASFKAAERRIGYARYTWPGRHVEDTYFMVLGYDAVKRTLSKYDLKTCAKEFGFAREGRVYIPGDQLSRTWLEDPWRVLEYAFDDVEEALALSAHLGAANFALAQMVPLPYQTVVQTGPGIKIEGLLVRDYVRQKYAIPVADTQTKQEMVGDGYDFGDAGTAKQEVGGLTDVFGTGLFRRVMYADVSSLYPSIMIADGIEPDGDDLRTFQRTLVLLTDLRLSLKRQAAEQEQRWKALAEAGDEGSEAYREAKRLHSLYDSQQAATKIIINGYYGYTSFRFGAFNDHYEADKVTIRGQVLLTQMKEEIERDGGLVIEIDTDGVLAERPPWVFDQSKGPTDEERAAAAERGAEPMGDEDYVRSLTERMPPGIKIDFDGRAAVMLSVRKKTYALREATGGQSFKDKIKGSSLKSRGIEPFRRAFVKECVEALLDDDARKLHDIYVRYWTKVVNHDWTPEEFAKTATLRDSLETYREKVRKGPRNGGRARDAGYELAIQREQETGVKAQPGDRITYFVAYPEGHTPGQRYKTTVFQDAVAAYEWTGDNENTEHYLAKLLESAKKFRLFFSPKEWDAIFSEVDVEGVDYGAIRVRRQTVKRKALRVIIAGSRDIEDIWWVERAMAGAKFLREIAGDVRLSGYEVGEVVCGMADGADLLGKAWAEARGIPVKKMPADWRNVDAPGAVVKTNRRGQRYNARAGHDRNLRMAEYAHEHGLGALVAVWDGRSRGTKNMIEHAVRLGLKIHVSVVPPHETRNPK